ncbi:hypothetical protein JOE31_001864 [Arthrobacter sp. PvP023]|nr:hypothetical protein [Arthrobacter sp. PvP023]
MSLIGPDPAFGGLDPFLDLGQERVRDPARAAGSPIGRPASLA